MSKATEALNAKGIINTNAMLEQGEPMIGYFPAQHVISQRWRVTLKGRRFINQPWYDHGAKTFSARRKSPEDPAFMEVLEWISKRNNIKEWARTPFGDYVPVAVLERHGIKPKRVFVAGREKQTQEKGATAGPENEG